MDWVPDDVLITIFHHYLNEQLAMPISLTPVCRRWYNILISVQSFWSRIVISNKIHSFPTILSSPGFELYLNRSDRKEPESDQVQSHNHINNSPFDIVIHCHPLNSNDHQAACGIYIAKSNLCLAGSCVAVKNLHAQLEDVLKHLAGVRVARSPYDGELGGKHEYHFRKRIERWRSLHLNLRGIRGTDRYCSSFPQLINPPSSAPRLSEIVVQEYPFTSVLFHPNFAPKLKSLVLKNSGLLTEMTAGLKELRTLALFNLQPRVTPRWVGPCPVQRLIVSSLEYIPLYGEPSFTNLKILQIQYGISRPFLSRLNSQFQQSNDFHRLERLELVNISNDTLEMLMDFAIAKSPYNIVFYTHIPTADAPPPDVGINLGPRSLPSTRFPPLPMTKANKSVSGVKEKTDIGLLKAYISSCHTDCEITGADEGAMDMLYAARGVFMNFR